MADLPEPISREDKLLHNIADKTPNIDDLVPISREEEYLKYIAMNGTAGGSGGGSGETVKVVQETGTSTTSVMSQNAVSEEFKKLGTNEVTSVNGKKGNVVVTADDVGTYTKSQIDNKMPAIVQTTGTLTDFVMSQNAVTNELNGKVDKVDGKGLSTEDFTTEEKEKLDEAVTKKYVDDKLAESGGGSNINVVQTTGTSETDVMSQKSVTDILATKVDAVEGKGLSTADFTTEEKAKLANIPDKIPEITIVQAAGTSETDVMSQKAVTNGLDGKVDKIDGKGLSTNDFTEDYKKKLDDAATKNYVDTRINPTILYSNDSGTTETITLSQPYTDFSRIGVYALGQYDVAMDSTYGEIYTPLEYMTLACVSGEKDDDGAYNCTVWRTAKIKFSENTITFVTNCASSFVKGDVGYKIGTDDGLKITRVVGYK